MKIYYAGEIPDQRSKYGLFLGGITNLGNSWRSYLMEKITPLISFEDIDIFIPEPIDNSITTWRDFMNTMPPGYNQIEWERQQSEYCQIWTMFLPTYANKLDSGDHFSTPSSNPEQMYPIPYKCLVNSLENKLITQEEFDNSIKQLTISNIGCQVRFEAGYLVGINKNLPKDKKIKVIWGKVYNSLQISFGPYLTTDETMHTLSKEELNMGHIVPDSFIAELVLAIQSRCV